MRPVRLEIEAFGPFGTTAEVDFELMPSDRPFLICGPTGAGKTSVFDAITYALYGSLPGHRSGHHDVRSDHADPRVECSVSLEFEVGAERWRVSRLPSQRRANKRGAGTAKVQARARLEHRRSDGWEPVSTGLADIRQRVVEIVGLEADQFQRVVLLPQGDFERVLNARSSERAELLRTLFGTEVFVRATARVEQERNDLEERLHHTASRTSTQRAGAHHLLRGVRAALVAPPAAAGSPGASEAPAPGADVADASGAAVVIDMSRPEPPPTAELRHELREIERGPLAERLAEAHSARARHEELSQALADGRANAAAITERERIRCRLAELDAAQEFHTAGLERLATARRVAPVVELLDRCDRAGRRAAEAAASGHRAWRAMLGACRAADMDLSGFVSVPPSVTIAGDLAERCGAAAHRHDDLARDMARAVHQRAAMRELAEARDQLQGQREELEAGMLRAEAESTDLRLALHSARSSAATLHDAEHRARRARTAVERRRAFDGAAAALELSEQRISEVEAERAALEQDLEAKHAELDAIAADVADLSARCAAVTGAEDLLRAAERLAAARPELDRAVAAVRAADREATAVFDRFVAGTAPRLAAALGSGNPCMVCGSTEHPAPAVVEDGHPVEAGEVDAARQAAADARTGLVVLEQTVTELLQRHPRAGTDSLVHLGRQLEHARSRAHAASTAQDRTAALREQVDDLSATIDALSGDVLPHRSTRDAARVAMAEATGALGEDAARSSAELEEAVVTAVAAVTAATAAGERCGEIQQRLEEIRSTRHQARERLAEIDRREALSAEELRRLDDEATAVEERIREMGGDATAAERAELARAAESACRVARDALVEVAGAAELHAELVAEVGDALESAGLGHDDEARAAALDAAAIDALEAATAQHARDRAVVGERLADLDRRALPREAPDVAALEARVAIAVTLATTARDLVVAAQRDLHNAEHLIDAVDELDRAHGADHARLAVLDDVVGVLTGRRTGQSITLEAWVLSAFLREVVEAANVHLRPVTHGRYELVVDSSHVKGNVRAGLDLSVLDAHSGRTRPTASLSGGETFQASLSLALGLADVLTAGSGGVRIDALFVDEGFGSLDGAAVDTAIDLLDCLRDRGTMVGVITHVEQMKEALPVALEVVPRADRRGSELVQPVLVT